MNRIILATLLSMFAATNAIAAGGAADQEGTIYAGVKVGPSDVGGGTTGFGAYGGYTLFGPNTFKNNDFFSKLSFAVEGEYVDLGKSTTWGITYSATTLGAMAAATYPLNEKFSIIVKAGMSSVTSKISGCGWWCNTSSTSIGLHTAAAGHFNITPKIGVRAGYDSYSGYRLMSASGVFKF